MVSILLPGAIAFLCSIIIASFFEWTIHRYVMHRPVGPFNYAFKTHALIHHQLFKADHTYHLIEEEDKWSIPMAWWNGPVLIMMCMIPNTPVALLLGSWPIFIGSLLAYGAYYGTYEYLHWCMHLPKARQLELSWWFRRINGHHLLHHRYMHKNFNVVLPIADTILGTIMLRSKIKFAQPRGPGVPDVQPLGTFEEPVPALK